MDKSQLRGALLQVAPKRQTITLFGQEVDIVAPSLDAQFRHSEITAEDLNTYKCSERGLMMSRQIISAVCVKGTDELVFEDTDIPAITKWPVTGEVRDLIDAINAVSDIGVAVESAKEELQNSPLQDA